MKIGLYAHGGSGNHGCEALARSSMRFLGEHEYTILSERPDDDSRYGLDALAQIVLSRLVVTIIAIMDSLRDSPS